MIVCDVNTSYDISSKEQIDDSNKFKTIYRYRTCNVLLLTLKYNWNKSFLINKDKKV